MKNKLFVLLGVLVVLSMALSACQPAAPAETIVETVIVEKEGNRGYQLQQDNLPHSVY